MTIRTAIIGFGKIAQDQHAPAIAGNGAFTLVAVARGDSDAPRGVAHFADHAEMLTALGSEIDAVAICTPPGPRYAIARHCLAAGLDVLLEKPPCATMGELDALTEAADAAGRTLFASWHSQYAPGVAGAAAALAGKRVRRLAIEWREDVRQFHPGQDWIWAPEGFGVFDSGMNALSIASRILPEPLLVEHARLDVPANRQTPIAARLSFAGDDLTADFDFGHAGEPCWTMTVETDDGTNVTLGEGGGRLVVDGTAQALPPRAEYPALYARFAQLIATRTSDVDRSPLRIVADALLVGERRTVAAFDWT